MQATLRLGILGCKGAKRFLRSQAYVIRRLPARIFPRKFSSGSEGELVVGEGQDKDVTEQEEGKRNTWRGTREGEIAGATDIQIHGFFHLLSSFSRILPTA
eukprot:1376864-Amorphochlora_amoeboformis.AAC.1